MNEHLSYIIWIEMRLRLHMSTEKMSVRGCLHTHSHVSWRNSGSVEVRLAHITVVPGSGYSPGHMKLAVS